MPSRAPCVPRRSRLGTGACSWLPSRAGSASSSGGGCCPPRRVGALCFGQVWLVWHGLPRRRTSAAAGGSAGGWPLPRPCFPAILIALAAAAACPSSGRLLWSTMCAKEELATERTSLITPSTLGRSYSSGDVVRMRAAARGYAAGRGGVDGSSCGTAGVEVGGGDVEGAGVGGGGGEANLVATSTDGLPVRSAAVCPHPYHIHALPSTEWNLCWASDESSSDDEAPPGHVGASALVRTTSGGSTGAGGRKLEQPWGPDIVASMASNTHWTDTALPDSTVGLRRRRRRPRPPREVTHVLARIKSGKPDLDGRWEAAAAHATVRAASSDSGPGDSPPSLVPLPFPPPPLLHQFLPGGDVTAGGEGAPPPSPDTLCKRSSTASISLRRLWRGWMPPARLAELEDRPGLHAYYATQNELLGAFREAASKSRAALPPADVVFLAQLDAADRAAADGEEGGGSVDGGGLVLEDSDVEAGRASLAAKAAEADEATRVQRAVYASNAANVFLLAAQVYAFLRSGSLSLMASTTDAALDFVSGLVVLYTWRLRSVRNKYSYPVGRARMEPLGVVLMACLMTAATLLVLEESIAALAHGSSETPLAGLTPVTAAVLLSALGVKGALYSVCSGIDDVAVSALATDHWNDVIANSMSLLTVFAAQAWVWWFDPLGGIAISALIIRNWVCATVEHVDQLLGRTADSRMCSLVTFLCLKHHPWVLKVDTVRAYHVGAGVFVECDIVLPGDMPLRIAHDIAESLQVAIEAHVDQVERAFVHADFDTDHSPELEHKTV